MVRGVRHIFFKLVLAVIVIAGVKYYMDNQWQLEALVKALAEEKAALRTANGKENDHNGEVRVDREEPSLPDDEPSMVFLRKYGRVKNLPSEEQIKMMIDKEVMYIIHSYLDNTDFLCNRQIRLGTASDGGYETCDDYRFRPIKPCIVYSFGIRNDFSFDDDAAKLYRCNVYSFDPGMKASTSQRSERVWYYHIGIGGKDRLTSKEIMGKNEQMAWQIMRFTEIKTMLHHENATIDILKIDIEASEWSALEDIVATGEIDRVRQLLIEFHVMTKKDLHDRLSLLQKLESHGFRRFRSHHFAGLKKYRNADMYPVERYCCYEMGFVNVNLARDFPPGK